MSVFYRISKNISKLLNKQHYYLLRIKGLILGLYRHNKFFCNIPLKISIICGGNLLILVKYLLFLEMLEIDSNRKNLNFGKSS